MTKQEKQAFLEADGILMRSGINAKGKPCMRFRTLLKDWHLIVSCENLERVQAMMNTLATRFPDKFQIDQDN